MSNLSQLREWISFSHRSRLTGELALQSHWTDERQYNVRQQRWSDIELFRKLPLPHNKGPLILRASVSDTMSSFTSSGTVEAIRTTEDNGDEA